MESSPASTSSASIDVPIVTENISERGEVVSTAGMSNNHLFLQYLFQQSTAYANKNVKHPTTLNDLSHTVRRSHISECVLGGEAC